jgi:hypothetical protein
MGCFTQTGHSCTRSYSVYRMEIEVKNILNLTTSDASLYKYTATERNIFFNFHTVNFCSKFINNQQMH